MEFASIILPQNIYSVQDGEKADPCETADECIHGVGSGWDDLNDDDCHDYYHNDIMIYTNIRQIIIMKVIMVKTKQFPPFPIYRQPDDDLATNIRACTMQS